MKNFALIGIGGYVAPRHLAAIHDTGNSLLAGLDPSDSVGIMDRYFPQASFFTEFERFDRYLDKCRRSGNPLHYLSVCSPNYLHDAHVRYGLKMGADVICEKPLVLNPWNLDALSEIESGTNNHIYTILQLRHHPDIVSLKEGLALNKGKKHEVVLTYIAPRGLWYYASWKGQIEKSGGIATNIGIHFFDMLIWLFGSVENSEVHIHNHDRAAGYLELEHANVRWFLSINADHLPPNNPGRRSYRSISLDGKEIEFSTGFEDLHSESYKEILKGNGFGLQDVRPSIQLVHQIREAETQPGSKNRHELTEMPTTNHPFKKKRP